MNREDYLKYLIEIKYGTVKAFSYHIKLPYTTIRSILDRGVMNAKMGNIIKICNGLDINPEDLLNVKNSLISKIIKTTGNLDSNRQKCVYNFAKAQLEDQSLNNT